MILLLISCQSVVSNMICCKVRLGQVRLGQVVSFGWTAVQTTSDGGLGEAVLLLKFARVIIPVCYRLAMCGSP